MTDYKMSPPKLVNLWTILGYHMRTVHLKTASIHTFDFVHYVTHRAYNYIFLPTEG